MWRNNLIDDRPLQICPRRLLLMAAELAPDVLAQMHRHAVEYYPLYTKGHLLLSGGLANQPAITMDYFRAIDHVRAVSELKLDEVRNQPLDGTPRRGEG